MRNHQERVAPATAEELIETVSRAFRFEGWKPIRRADEFTARIAAERLVEYLEHAGFVVMKKRPPAPPRVP
jgi:hypothetical protein